MNWLAENSLPIWVCGAIAMTMSIIVYYQTRSRGSLVGIAAVAAITALFLFIEWMIETPREAVEHTLYKLADTVEANDVPGTFTFLAASAKPELRSDVETLMPAVNIDRANIVGTPKIDLPPGPDLTTATAQVRGIIVATIRRNGMKGGQDDVVTLQLVREGDQWRIESYTSKKNWQKSLGQ